MKTHAFAICAYQQSPYLEACIRSLKRQTVPSKIILCTSTPCGYLKQMAKKYRLPLFVRDGASDIQKDWNFAYSKADADLVTIAHQDDCYHKTYAEHAIHCWETYPDTTVFMTSCAIIKNGNIQRRSLVLLMKSILRLPLKLHAIADQTWVKRAALSFGNPVVCPSCTYHKAVLGEPLFQSPYKFVLDWDTMWTLAAYPGRFYCEELPLVYYRVHNASETKRCIENNRRFVEESKMYSNIWPVPVAKLLMMFYRRAYAAYR